MTQITHAAGPDQPPVRSYEKEPTVMNEQPQDIQPTQADVDSLVAKFDAFTATLTPGEHAAFGQLLQAAADGDVQGYLLAPQIVVQLQLNNGIRPPMVKGSYPPGVRTDASR